MNRSIPTATRNRLPQYLRILKEFKERGSDHICSYQIGNILDISDATVRKDLSILQMTVGKSAYGYDVDRLIEVLEKEIGFNKNEKMILIGVGAIGNIIITNYNFNPNRYGKIVAAFDITQQFVNTKIGSIPVYDFAQLSKKIPKETRIAIVTTPKEHLEMVINKLISLKIEIVINFTTGYPRKRKKIDVYNIDLSEIIAKSIYMSKSKNK